jgi:hypothetical protein
MNSNLAEVGKPTRWPPVLIGPITEGRVLINAANAAVCDLIGPQSRARLLKVFW